jgi:hypothetical protein
MMKRNNRLSIVLFLDCFGDSPFPDHSDLTFILYHFLSKTSLISLVKETLSQTNIRGGAGIHFFEIDGQIIDGKETAVRPALDDASQILRWRCPTKNPKPCESREGSLAAARFIDSLKHP